MANLQIFSQAKSGANLQIFAKNSPRRKSRTTKQVSFRTKSGDVSFRAKVRPRRR